MFEQTFLNGVPLRPKNGSKDGVRSVFPSFTVGNDHVALGALIYHGTFAGKQAEAVRWGAAATSSLRGGLQGTGPIVLFSQEEAVVVSFASSFMAGNYVYNGKTNSVDYGIAGGVTTMPKGFKLSTIVTTRDQGKLPPFMGVRDMMKDWGSKLMAMYALKRRGRKENDFTTTYLSYSTDVSLIHRVFP